MILDTTYFLPLARIDVDADLLRAVADGKVNLKLGDIALNLISVFEVQAKAAKLKVPAKFVVEAVKAMLTAFRVEPFYKAEIIEIALAVRKLIPDYVDCVMVATAVVLKEHLVTEDSRILSKRELMKKEYGIKISSYKELIKEQS